MGKANRTRLDPLRPEHPDVFWVLTTQWRGQAVGWAGDPNVRTPHLDRIGAAGVVVAQAVANHPFGPFSRAGILTGRSTIEAGVRDYFDPLPADQSTVAAAFGSAGYTTAWFGKWHLGKKLRDQPPVGEAQARIVTEPDRRGGFDWWEGFEGGFLNRDPWLHGSGWREPVRMPGYQPDVLVDRLCSYLDRRTDRNPVFAVLSLEPPHPPYGEFPSSVIPPRPGDLALRPNVTRGDALEARIRKELSAYYGQIEAVDHALGRLHEHLARSDRPRLFLFTSVHGDMHGSQGVLRKGWPYEESIRVPLLFHGSGLLDPGMRTDGVFGLNNLASTSLGLAGVKTSQGVGGEDLSSWIRGSESGPEAVSISMPSVPPFPPNCSRAWNGIRTVDRMAVWNEDRSPWLAYDLKADPDQLHPVVDGSLHREFASRIRP